MLSFRKARNTRRRGEKRLPLRRGVEDAVNEKQDAIHPRGIVSRRAFFAVLAWGALGTNAACAQRKAEHGSSGSIPTINDVSAGSGSNGSGAASIEQGPTAEELKASLDLTEMYYDELSHGEKGPAHQRYIMLHDTEGGGSPEGVISGWLNSGSRVAAHFVVGRDGHMAQCVPLDCIAHHAGFGDTGHNELYGVEDESRDDRIGTVPIGSWASDYGMNSYSIGIEMVHEGARGEGYPEAQLAAIDKLIAYIDAYYGFESRIIDHNDWRSGNSDCSQEFQGYLANYQDHRTHDDADENAEAQHGEGVRLT
jgi:N-acetyl-anhydromuramyl-L-alanine amidase AmpD